MTQLVVPSSWTAACSRLVISLTALFVSIAPLSRATDYLITTANNSIVITDNSGNSDTMTISEPSAGNIKFAVTGRTFSIDGGADITGAATNSLTGVTNVTINLGAGNDNANFGTFTAALPNITVNGGDGNDNVNLTGNLTFAADANLDLNLQNDSATPGVDTFTVSSGKTIAFSGAGGLDARVSQFINLAGATITSVNGNIYCEANQQATPTSGNFIGIEVTGGAVQISGSGNITLKGRGGNAAGATLQVGVRIGYIGVGGGTVTTSTGSITIVGQGGASSGSLYHRGVIISAYNSFYATVATGGGDINITGIGGGDGVNNGNLHIGVDIEGNTLNGGHVSVTAGGSGSINITGIGGNTRNTGTGNATTYTSSYGIFNGNLIQAGGNITLTGIGGSGPAGFQFDNVGAYLGGTIKSTGGNVTIIGAEGGGSSATLPPTGLILGSVQSGPSGTIKLFANSAKLNGTINAGANTTWISQLTNGVAIDLGDSTDFIGGPLTLSGAEVSRFVCSKLIIGDTNTGSIFVNNAVSTAASTPVILNAGGTISINTNGITTLGGNLVINTVGASNVFSAPGISTDVNLSGGTLSFSNATTFAVGINGATNYDALNLVGKISLTNVSLAINGSYTPANGDSFMIISNDSSDAIAGTFAGLPENTILSVNGVNKKITYVGGDGNDVVLLALPSSDANLLALAVSTGTVSPAFNSNIVSYVVNVPNATTSVTFTPTKSDAGATVTVNGGNPATPVSLSVGTNNVTIFVTAADGVTTKSYTVSVIRSSNTAPAITTPASPVIAEATGPSGAVVNFSVTASDNEDGVLVPVATPASGSTFALGTNTVTAKVTDSGGLSVTNTFLVIVRDTTAPMISVPSNLDIGTLNLTGATASFAVSANDLVDGSVTATATPASGSLFPVGTNIVTVTAADSRGNSGTNTFVVVVSNPPELHIVGNTSLVTVFWQDVTGWGLRQNSDLLQNVWDANTNATLTAGTNYLMVPNPTGNEFYRLAHP